MMNIGTIRCSDGKFINTGECSGSNDWNIDGTLNYTEYQSPQTGLIYRQTYSYTDGKLSSWTEWELQE